ncbi:MAG TPA: P-loop NTPase fold protein, partial [Longilinea sp.]|nr:P-loop NTPase fold protein [Longilinea sp.]
MYNIIVQLLTRGAPCPKKNSKHQKSFPTFRLSSGETASFHFDRFAITLARLIANKKTRTPLTIGVSGSWGTGKTTLLRRIQQQLDKTMVLIDETKPALMDFVNSNEVPQKEFRVCRTVWFDVWKYTGEDQILAALLR